MVFCGPDPPTFYTAQYLSRISSISLLLYTPLPSVYTPKCITFPYLSNTNITLHYTNNAHIQITLPAKFKEIYSRSKIDLTNVPDQAHITLSIKTVDANLVIPAHEADGIKRGPKFYSASSQDVLVPWNHIALTQLSSNCLDGNMSDDHRWSMSCAVCRTPIIPNCGTTIQTWKALPSETWAEMMDFWHCHKPHNDNHKDHEHSHTQFNKAYAVSKFIPSPNSAMVGVSYILFHISNIPNISVPSSNLNRPGNFLQCQKCQTTIGVQDTDTSYKLWKWNLSFNSKVIPPFFYVSAIINELITSHAVYNFAISQEVYQYAGSNDSSTKQGDKIISPDKVKILLWVVNADIRYTSTFSQPLDNLETSHRGFKILYSDEDAMIPELQEKNEQMEIEQLWFPEIVIASLLQHLQENKYVFSKFPSAKQSPPSLPVSKGWKESILEKYSQ